MSDQIRPQFWIAGAVMLALLVFSIALTLPKSAPAIANPKPAPTPDDYADLRRVDRYKDLKRQAELLKRCDAALALNASRDPFWESNGSQIADTALIEVERQRNIKSYSAVRSIAARLLEAQNDSALYDALAEKEKDAIDQIEFDRISDQNDLERVGRQNALAAAGIRIVQKSRRVDLNVKE